MRAFVTGATGFVGGRLVSRLRERGDTVVALVRSPARASALRAVGCELLEGDLGSVKTLERGIDGCEAVFHAAGLYRLGIPASERAAMYEVNVRGTERVLDAAIAAGTPRIVYVSTVNVFGDTRDEIVSEEYERPGRDFLSYYDESKFLAHEAARARIEEGGPVSIGQPGVVYGPGDTSQLGDQIRRAQEGRLRYVSFPRVGCNAVHVDDVAAGLLAIHDGGRVGESYVLGGELTRVGEVIAIAAAAAGRRPPRLTMPTALVRLSAPLAPLLGPRVGLPANLREVVRASDGVTYWATDAKARRELGYSPRDLEQGMRDTAAASGPAS